jgi:glycosyltransferase involved in cell wall biosynthesis
VILPTYNGESYLAQTLASVASQADERVELIAIDDGSTDQTLSILKTHARHLPLRIFARPRIGNWVANTNFGLAQARGQFVSFLHQDDLWLPGRLRALRELTEKQPQAEFFLHAARYIGADGRWLGLWRAPLAAGDYQPGELVDQLLVQNFLAVPATMFSRALAHRVGGLDESLWYTADWDFWLKLAKIARCAYSPRPLAAFRIHSFSQTAQGVHSADEMRRQMAVVLDRALPTWQSADRRRQETIGAAWLSVAVNYALAQCAGGMSPRWRPLLRDMFQLGIAGLCRFVRDSRITERVAARVRARIKFTS